MVGTRRRPQRSPSVLASASVVAHDELVAVTAAVNTNHSVNDGITTPGRRSGSRVARGRR
jgi:hypothetical protein